MKSPDINPVIEHTKGEYIVKSLNYVPNLKVFGKDK